MKLSQNQIVFIALLVLFFFILSRTSVFISESHNVNIELLLIVSGIIFVVLVVVFKNMLCETKDKFYWELTPEKHCDGGSYMYSSDPAKKKYCSQFTPEQLRQYQCGTGFHGRPVTYERTQDSNDTWQNELCSSGFNYDYPKVL